MIVTEKMILDGRHFIRTYSDEGRYVVRDGIAYDEAVDPAEFGREYTEGDIIEGMSETETGEITDTAALNIIIRGSMI